MTQKNTKQTTENTMEDKKQKGSSRGRAVARGWAEAAGGGAVVPAATGREGGAVAYAPEEAEPWLVHQERGGGAMGGAVGVGTAQQEEVAWKCFGFLILIED